MFTYLLTYLFVTKPKCICADFIDLILYNKFVSAVYFPSNFLPQTRQTVCHFFRHVFCIVTSLLMIWCYWLRESTVIQPVKI